MDMTGSSVAVKLAVAQSIRTWFGHPKSRSRLEPASHRRLYWMHAPPTSTSGMAPIVAKSDHIGTSNLSHLSDQKGFSPGAPYRTLWITIIRGRGRSMQRVSERGGEQRSRRRCTPISTRLASPRPQRSSILHLEGHVEVSSQIESAVRRVADNSDLQPDRSNQPAHAEQNDSIGVSVLPSSVLDETGSRCSACRSHPISAAPAAPDCPSPAHRLARAGDTDTSGRVGVGTSSYRTV